MNRIISPEIDLVVKQSTLSPYGEDRNDLFVLARIVSCFRGSYLRHVIKGGHGNKGDPSSSLRMRVEPNKLNK